MWDIRRFAQLDKFPAGERVVIHFQFTDAPRGERLWWLVVEDRTADLCRDDPGHEVTVEVESTVRALDRGLDRRQRSGQGDPRRAA